MIVLRLLIILGDIIEIFIFFFLMWVIVGKFVFVIVCLLVYCIFGVILMVIVTISGHNIFSHCVLIFELVVIESGSQRGGKCSDKRSEL